MTTSTTKRTANQGLPAKVGHFLLHFVEMCLGACVGAGILSVAFFGGAALVGYTDLIGQAPAFSTLVLTINFTLPMVGWLRFRRHKWRPALEMGATNMALGILLIGASWLGLIPVNDIFELEASLCCPSMLLPMLLRLNLYTEGHHVHAA